MTDGFSPDHCLQVSVESLGSNESQLEIDMCCGLPENSGLSGTGKVVLNRHGKES